jgi:filamentous hemagglutinin family protein
VKPALPLTNLLRSIRRCLLATIGALAICAAATSRTGLAADAALPSGGDVVAGAAAISTSGAMLNVDVASQRAIINWESFNVGDGHAANFHLPDANSAVLNRVTGATLPSVIAGQLNSNGSVYLVNPSGVLVTPTGVINSNGFTASTYDIANQDFLDGVLRFSGAGGAILNQGLIKSGAGGATLIADQVQNAGRIESNGGNINLAAGGSVTLENGVVYSQPSANTLVSGISTTAGLIQNSGVIRATGAATSGGEVYLVNPGGRLLHEGVIAASRAGETPAGGNVGGRVQLEADAITLSNGSVIDASGEKGGGEVLVGGPWQGSASGDADTFAAHATSVTMEAGASIDASASKSGDGGTVVLWSDTSAASSFTKASGSLSARGGALSGDGGRIETSGGSLDTMGAVVDAGAPAGAGGTWLLDPYNYTINASAATSIAGALNAGTSVEVTTSTSNTAYGGSTNPADVGDITVTSAITKSTGVGDATLTLRAHNTINVTAPITSTAGKLNVVLLSDSDGSGDGRTRIGSVVTTNGGGLWVGGNYLANSSGGSTWIPYDGAAPIAVGDGYASTPSTLSVGAWGIGATISTGGGNLAFYGYSDSLDEVNASFGVALTNSSIGTAGGSIVLEGISQYTAATAAFTTGVQVRNSTLNSASGDITIEGALGGSSQFINGAGVWIGRDISNDLLVVGDTTISTTSGDVRILGVGADAAGSGWRHGIAIITRSGGNQVTISTVSGDITLDGTANFLDGSTTDTSGLQLQISSAVGAIDIVSQTGDITLRGANTQEGSVHENGIRFTTGNAADQIRIGYDGTNAYSGDILIQTNSLLQRTENAGAGSIVIQGVGALTIESIGPSFTALRAGDVNSLTFDDDWDFGATLSSFTLGKAANTLDLTLSEPLSIAGAISLYGGAISVNGGLTSSATGDIYIQSNAAVNGSIAISGLIAKTGGARSTMTLRGDGRVAVHGGVSASGAALDTVLWSDYHNTGSGGVSIMSNIDTGGGHLWAGGSSTNGGSTTWNGLTVGNGPSVGANGFNHNAMDLYANVTTGGGDVLIVAGDGYDTGINGIGIANSPVINSGAGDITLIADAYAGSTVVAVTSTGVLAIQPYTNAWDNYGGQLDYDGVISGGTFTGAGDVGWLVINNYSSLGGLTLGKPGITMSVRVYDPLDLDGPLSIYGTAITLAPGVTVDTTGGGAAGSVLLDSTSDVFVNGAVSAGGGITVNGGAINVYDSMGSASGNVAITGTSNVTLHDDLSAAGNVTMSAGNDLILSGALTRTGAANTSTLLSAVRHVVLNTAANVGTNGGSQNLKLWADTDDSGDGINTMYSTSIATHGGSFTVGNGDTATINGASVLVGGDIYLSSASAQTIDTAGGDIAIYGETILANASASGVTFDSGGGDILFDGIMNSGNQYTYVDGPDGQPNSWSWARNDAKNGGSGGSAIGDSYLVTITSRLENAIAGIAATYRGAWIGAHRPDPAASYNWAWADGPEGGDVFFVQSSGGGGSTESGWYANFNSVEPNGTLSANGESVGQFFGTAGEWNDLAPATTFAATQVNQYSVLGYVRETNLTQTAVTIDAGDGVVTVNGGIGASKVLASLAVSSGGVTINGNALATAGAQTFDSALTVVSASDLNVSSSGLTADGDVHFQGSTLTLTGNVTASNAGDVLLRANSVSLPGTMAINTTGALTIEPLGASFSSALTYPLSNLSTPSTLGGLTLGKPGNTANITVNGAQNVGGPISIYGGAVAINSPVTTTGTIILQGTSTVAQGVSGDLSASALALLGGNVTLTNPGNNVDTLAAVNVGALAFVDSDALTIGEATATGVSATGQVNIATLTGDLTLEEDVATTDTSNAALLLNAGRNAAAGTATGGNVVFSGSPSVTVGTGGRATLMTGTVAGSTGLTDLAGAGSGRFRYNSDESAANYTLALGAGLYAVYREQPTTTVSVDDEIITYSDTLPTWTFSITNEVNGDTFSQVFQSGVAVAVGGATSTSGNYAAGDHALTMTPSGSQLGYAIIAATDGVLSVEGRSVTVAATATDKVYDGGVSASFTGSSADIVGGDAVTFGGTATFSDKNVGSNKTVGVTGIALGGADAVNYLLTNTSTTTTASITPATLALTGVTGGEKIYDGQTDAPLVGVASIDPIGDDSVQLTGGLRGAFANPNAGTNKAMALSGVTLEGADAANYLLQFPTNLTGNITLAPLVVRAISDAKFVTKPDAPGYAGAVYLGFVNGESSGVLSGSLVITRTNSDEAAGYYSDVLMPSGISSSNYAIEYAPGGFEIVPADQLLVRFAAGDSVYGAGVAYTFLSAQYMDDDTTVYTLGAPTVNGTYYTFSDGSGGSASFTVGLSGESYGTGGSLDVGAYDVSLSNVVVTSNNFSNTISVVGAHTVDAAPLTIVNAMAAKTYDGTTALNDLTVNFTGMVVGDDVRLDGEGQFLSRNAGTDVGYTVDGLFVGGADGNNYYLIGDASMLFGNGVISPKEVTLTAPTGIKVYDGNTSYAPTPAQLDALSLQLGVPGDYVSGVTLFYNTPDPGTGKTLTPVAATIDDGTGGANYVVTFAPNTSSSILPPFRNADFTGQTVYDAFVRYDFEAAGFFTDYWRRVLDMWESPTWRIDRRGSQAVTQQTHAVESETDVYLMN